MGVTISPLQCLFNWHVVVTDYFVVIFNTTCVNNQLTIVLTRHLQKPQKKLQARKKFSLSSLSFPLFTECILRHSQAYVSNLSTNSPKKKSFRNKSTSSESKLIWHQASVLKSLMLHIVNNFMCIGTLTLKPKHQFLFICSINQQKDAAA